MKKQLAIAIGMSLAASAAMAGNEGEYTESDTMDPSVPSETSTMDTSIPSETSIDTGTSTATNFEDLDVNQDSLISEQEATDSLVMDSEAFASADTDQDGSLSQEEFDAAQGGGKEETAMEETAMNFEDLDVNQDSLISEQEATDSQLLDSEAFASADANQDGYLSQTEFDAQGSASIEEPAEFETETETEIDDAS